MIVECLDTPHNFETDVEEEGVGDLIDDVGQDEVDRLAQLGPLLVDYFLVPELVNGETEKDQDRRIHHPAHELPNFLVVVQEVRGLLGVKVADLEENYGLDEARCDQD